MDNSYFTNSYYGICIWSLVLYSVPIHMEQQNEKLRLSQNKMTAKHLMPILLLVRTFWCQSINKKRDAIWKQRKNTTYQEYERTKKNIQIFHGGFFQNEFEDKWLAYNWLLKEQKMGLKPRAHFSETFSEGPPVSKSADDCHRIQKSEASHQSAG